MKMPSETLLKRLDWNLLRVFIVIVQEKSITKSAQRLLLTQPAVSSALKRLEESLDARLINRSNKNISLTKAGERLYKECLQVQGTIANIAHILEEESPDQVYGEITLHISQHMYCAKLLHTVHDFHEKHQNVEIRYHRGTHDEVMYAVLNHKATLGIVSKQVDIKNFQHHVMDSQPYGLYCSHKCSLYQHPVIDKTVLAQQKFYVYHTESIIGSLNPLIKYRNTHGLTNNIYTHMESVWDMLQLIQSGSGIGFLPQSMDVGKLWHIPIADPPIITTYGIFNYRNKYNMAEKALLQHLHFKI